MTFVRACRDAGKPFFVWYAPMLPHDPHDPPEELVEHYCLEDRQHPCGPLLGQRRAVRPNASANSSTFSTPKSSQPTRSSSTSPTTAGSSGPTQPRFAARSKLSPYDGGLRTPIMLRRPGRIAPATSDALASSLDILPTVLAACDVPVPAGLPGVNLLDPQAVAARRQLFGECYTHTLLDLDDPARSLMWRWTVRQDGDHLWKLIEPVTADGRARARPGRAAMSPRRIRPATSGARSSSSTWPPTRGRNEIVPVKDRMSSPNCGQTSMPGGNPGPRLPRRLLMRAAASRRRPERLPPHGRVHCNGIENDVHTERGWRASDMRPGLQPILLCLGPPAVWLGIGLAAVPADHWPNWRGPGLDGVAAGTGYVASWRGGEPGREHSLAGQAPRPRLEHAGGVG